MGEPLIFRPERSIIGPYKLTVTLGTGSTGKVKLGIHEETGIKVAVKVIDKANFIGKPQMQIKIQREIAIMKLIDHPHIIGLYEVYETTEHLYLIIEHIEGGELFDYLVSKGRLVPAEALHFFQQIISGVNYCHLHLICHRDLKPENLLLDLERNIKIADFGMSSLMKPGTQEMLQTSCGSPHYACPEVVTAREYDGRAADVWSCGVILYALVVGKLPFDDDNIRRLLTKVKSGLYSIPSFVPTAIKELIHMMLTVDPEKRITVPEILEISWFKSRPMKSLPRDESHIFDMSYKPLKIEQIDDKILNYLLRLGWGSKREVMNSLAAPGDNLEKVFYNMFVQREKRLGNMPENTITTLLKPETETDRIAKEGKELKVKIEKKEKEKKKEEGKSKIDSLIDQGPVIKTRQRRNTVAETNRPTYLVNDDNGAKKQQLKAPEDVKVSPPKKKVIKQSPMRPTSPTKISPSIQPSRLDDIAPISVRNRSTSVATAENEYSRPKLKSFRPRMRRSSRAGATSPDEGAKKSIWFSGVFGSHEKSVSKKGEASSLIYTDVTEGQIRDALITYFEGSFVIYKLLPEGKFKARVKGKDSFKFAVDIVKVTGGSTIFINFSRRSGSSNAYRMYTKILQETLNDLFEK